MSEEIDFKIGHFRSFDVPVTLTLTSDDLESHIVENNLSTSTNTIYWFVATLSLIVDGHFSTKSISAKVISADEQR